MTDISKEAIALLNAKTCAKIDDGYTLGADEVAELLDVIKAQGEALGAPNRHAYVVGVSVGKASQAARIAELEALTLPKVMGFLDRWCLQVMDEGTPSGYGFWGFPLRSFTQGELTSDIVRGVLRSLTDRGLARFQKGLSTEDGEVAGSGYGITDAGRAALKRGPTNG